MLKSFATNATYCKSHVIRASNFISKNVSEVILVEKDSGFVVAYGDNIYEMKVWCDINMIDYVVE